MGILLWIVLGLIAGWVASIIMKTDAQQGMFMDIVLGIAGALVGGFVLNFFGSAGVTGFNIESLLVSIFGAVVLIALGRMLQRRA